MTRNKEASDLQEMTRLSEAEQPAIYDDDDVRKATVHTRQDLVLVVSHLSSIGDLLASIRVLLAVVAIAAVVVATVLVWP